MDKEYLMDNVAIDLWTGTNMAQEFHWVDQVIGYRDQQ